MTQNLSLTEKNVSTLWQLKQGQCCVILDFKDTLDPRYKVRVLELGFRPQTEVTCIKAPAFGAPKVYQISKSVFSLEDSIGTCINVAIR